MIAEEIGALGGIWRILGDTGSLAGLEWQAVLGLANRYARGDELLEARILDACRYVEAGAIEGNAAMLKQRGGSNG